ncbi:MAG: hypothetical protein OJF49_004133 [Ktedonobacterales bacterium]|nr:MAG: hypothetical protein OJF49_004133 [Ktedonobacterales bacterium]
MRARVLSKGRFPETFAQAGALYSVGWCAGLSQQSIPILLLSARFFATPSS